jgi:hypothetical protein
MMAPLAAAFTPMSLDSPLGSYPDREEYQVDRVLVNIEIPSHGARQAWLEVGKTLFPDAWLAIPRVIEAAEHAAREEQATLWQQLDQGATGVGPLAVYDVWINPVTGGGTYRVGSNWDFPFPQSVEFPEDYFILVERDAAGGLRAFGGLS